MNEENIELRSENVQEILGRPPKWIIRWGISIIFIVVAGLIIGSYFFKYPDVIEATITVTTENLPAGLMAKTTGKIDTIFVLEKQLVKKGDLLAVIENPACFKDISELKDLVTSYELQVTNGNKLPHLPAAGTPSSFRAERGISSFFLSPFSFLPSPQLGELQAPYQQFVKSFNDYQYFITTDYHHKKIKVIEKQIRTQNLILQKTKKQLELAHKQLEAAEQVFTIDSNLYEKKVLSNAEYQNAKWLLSPIRWLPIMEKNLNSVKK